MNILIGSVGICNYFGCVSPVYYVFKPTKKADLLFINYIMQTIPFQKELRRYANGILEIRLRVSANGILKRKIAIPSLEKQKNIVDGINKKCAAVDRLIENQQAQIEKLKEYKQSVITEAVTRGLAPSVPMKASGVEWLGKIPSIFSIQNVRSLFQIRKEIIGREPETVLSITQSGLKIKNILENEGQMANSYANYQIVHIGDFAMNHMDLLTGGIGISQYEGVTSPDYRVFEIKEVKYIKKYFLLNHG